MSKILTRVKSAYRAFKETGQEDSKVPDTQNSSLEHRQLTPEEVQEVRDGLSKTLPSLPAPDLSQNTMIVLEIKKLTPGEFPVLKDEKIHHSQFITRKEEYVNAAFEAIRPYFEYLLHLPPIARNTEMSKAIEHILKGFIAIYWDMPSSKEHHDSMPFGHLKHSLVVACREAERVSRQIYFNESGSINSEKTRKQRPYIVLASFLSGLFHDASKIFSYDLSCVLSNDTKLYSPFHGSASILEFLMKYPSSRIRRRWQKNDYPNIYFGFHLFYNLVPKSLRLAFPTELYEFLYSSMLFYKGMADQIATRDALEADNYLGKIQSCTHELVMQTDALNHPEGWGFKISPAWYLVLHSRFLAELAHQIGAVRESCEKVLLDSGVMFSPQGKRKSVISIQIFSKSEKNPTKSEVVFIAAQFFDNILAKTEHSGPVPVYDLKIAQDSKVLLDSLGMEPPLPDSVFKTTENRPARQPEVNKAAPEPPMPEKSPEMPSEASEEKTTPPQADAPSPQERAPETSKPVQCPKDLKKQISKEFLAALPHLPKSMGQALANAIGLSNKDIISPYHIQNTPDARTVFYFLEDHSLIARTPLILRTTWTLMLNEAARGLHPWHSEVQDLPVALTGEDILSKLLIQYVFSTWVQMGFLIPSGKDHTFELASQSVKLIHRYSKKGVPTTILASIYGKFVRLAPEAFNPLTSERPEKYPVDAVLAKVYADAYGKK